MTEKTILIGCVIVSLVLSPFIYYRHSEGDYFVATVDILIVLALMYLFISVYRAKNLNTAKLLLASLLTVTIVAVVVIRGIPHTYWLYPAIIAFHYILPSRQAGVISLISIAIISFSFYPETTFIDFLTVSLSLVLTVCLSFLMFKSFRDKNKQLANLAKIDPLTLAGNRLALNTTLSNVISEQQQKPCDIALLLINVDSFKKVNDKYGHTIGDQILAELIQLMTKNMLSIDKIFRFGGKEFVVTPLPLNLRAARKLAEKIRVLVASHTFSDSVNITISIGVTLYQLNESAESWLSRADKTVNQAKVSGRNTVMTEKDLTQVSSLK